jgi:hypothetical protein
MSMEGSRNAAALVRVSWQMNTAGRRTGRECGRAHAAAHRPRRVPRLRRPPGRPPFGAAPPRCGRPRRLAAKTLTALERLLDADDLIIVNLGVEKVIRLTKQGFMPTPEDDEADAPPANLARAQRALPAASVKDEIAQLRGEA